MEDLKMPRERKWLDEELRLIQDEMLHVAHELTLAQARVHRLRARVELPEEDHDDDDGRRPLSFEVHGDLESAAEDLETAVAALRRGGLETDEILERKLLREQRERQRGKPMRIVGPAPLAGRGARSSTTGRHDDPAEERS